jgi:hypothetical protein
LPVGLQSCNLKWSTINLRVTESILVPDKSYGTSFPSSSFGSVSQRFLKYSEKFVI